MISVLTNLFWSTQLAAVASDVHRGIVIWSWGLGFRLVVVEKVKKAAVQRGSQVAQGAQKVGCK